MRGIRLASRGLVRRAIFSAGSGAIAVLGGGRKVITLSGQESLSGTKDVRASGGRVAVHGRHAGSTTGSYSLVVKPVRAARHRVYIEAAGGGQGPTSHV